MSREICIVNFESLCAITYYELLPTTYIKTHHVGAHIIETFVGR
jgi:hypothetical protein